VAQFHAHARIAHYVPNVAGFLSMLCHDPELLTNESIAHRGTARLSSLATRRFQERIPRRDQADRKQRLDGRIEQVFLKKVHNAMFHCLVLTD
jgi:hypothetical protein